MRLAFLYVLLLLSPALAFASFLSAHVISEPGFTRIVIGPQKSRIKIDHHGDDLRISLSPPATKSASTGHGELVQSAKTDGGELVFVLRDHASTRQIRQGALRMIDVFAPVAPPVPENSFVGVPAARVQARQLVPGLPAAFGAVIDNPRSPAKPISPRDPASGTPPAKPLPVAPAGHQIAPEPVPADAVSAILIPFSPDVGVAALRRAHAAVIFFDEPRPLDLSAFRADPIFGRASVTMQSSFTELRLPLDPDRFVSLSRREDGWLLSITAKEADLNPIDVSPSGPELRFHLKAPGKTLNVIDPDTGALLLVGTDRLANSAVRLRHRSSTVVIDRTQIGVVVEPISDHIELRATGSGFNLSRDDGMPVALAAPGPPNDPTIGSGGLSRSLAIPRASAKLLWRQLQDQLFAAATSPSRARLRPRLAAAQTLLALGMTREARTLTRVAFTDDPLATNDPRARLIRAITEALSDPRQAFLLADPVLPSTDEMRLWRALAGPHDPSARDEDAAAIREGMPLLLAYPDHLRELAAGLSAPILLAHGGRNDREALAALPTTSRTVVAQQVANARAGRLAEALARLGHLSQDADLKTSCDAVLASSSLRVAQRMLSPRAAADELDVHRLDCRSAGEEGAALLLEAEDRWQAGQASQAFDLWREAERHFPDLAAEARARTLDNLSRLATTNVADRVSAADFVQIMSDAAPELASNDDLATRLAPVLADRLEALDLPARATGILRQVMAATSPGPARAKLGAKLASALIEQDDAQGAMAALDQSEAPDLTAEVARERRLARTRALEHEGDYAGALAALGGDQDSLAQDLRADIDAASNHWHDAKLVLASLAQSFPPRGALSGKDEDIAIRLATAASRDGDKALLLGLARRVEGRFLDPGQRDTFNLITAPLMQRAVPDGSSLEQAPGSG